MFISDLIVADAEIIFSKLNIFCNYYQKLKRISENFLSIKKCSFYLTTISYQFDQKIHDFDSLMPELVTMYKSELAFKIDSIDEFAFSNNLNMYSSIVSSWVYGVYIDSAMISTIHALIL